MGNGLKNGEWTAGRIAVVACTHERVMKGESDEVVRRTRSEAAEAVVLKAVGKCGYEPEWFVERWLESGRLLSAEGGKAASGGKLLAVAAFREDGHADKFKAALEEIASDDARNVEDVRIAEEMAGVFGAAWKAAHEKAMEDFRKVADDAKERYCGRMVVGKCAVDGKDALEKWFGELAEKWPHDADGLGGFAYGAIEDADDGVVSWCVGAPSANGVDEAVKSAPCWSEIVGRLFDAKKDDVVTQLVARVAVKMQSDEKAIAEKKDAADESAKKMEEFKDAVAKAVAEGVKEGVAADAAKAMD